jgi:hypothetical protein
MRLKTKNGGNYNSPLWLWAIVMFKYAADHHLMVPLWALVSLWFISAMYLALFL